MTISRLTNRKQIVTGLAVASMLLATTACGSAGNASTPSNSGAQAAGTSSNGTLRIGTDPTYPPYQFKEGGELVGLELDLGRAIGKALDKKIEFVEVKYTAGLTALSAARFDALMIGGTIDSPDRQKQFTLVDEFNTSEGLIVPTGNPKGLKDKAGLCGHSVSVFQASEFENSLKAASAQCGSNPINILSMSDANGPFDALKTGRAEAYFGNYVQGSYQAKTMGLDSLKVTDGKSYLGAILVKLGNEEVAQELAKGLQQVIASGEGEKIAAKYGIPGSELVQKVTINAGNIPVRDAK